MPKKAKTSPVKRYHMVLPQDLFDAVEAAANARSTTTVDMIRQFLRLGVLATQPGTEIVLREMDSESVIILL